MSTRFPFTFLQIESITTSYYASFFGCHLTSIGCRIVSNYSDRVNDDLIGDLTDIDAICVN